MAELVPIPFGRLLRRMYHEFRKTGAIFDLPSGKFYRPSPDVDLSVSFCGKVAATPVGPAAGPQTQLAQNIVLSWLAGGRIIELKTVQINDRLRLSRPCIDMATVGYNTEWSQELRLEDSLREYVKASMMIEMLQDLCRGSWFSLQDPRLPSVATTPRLDTILDISVGYDLAGIQSREIRSWLGTMRNASSVIDELRNHIPDEFAAYRQFPFRTEISNSITLSTFHGTPADEIERICAFLLEELDFHVIIKMNPPMLGKEQLEHLLHEVLGYHTVEVSQQAFDVNLTFMDAVDIVRRLESIAARCRKTVGVKFGNTLEVVNRGSFLKETVQYLSGRPLHVLHLALVNEWRKVFGADVPISFSAGVDAQNFSACVSAGLVPITSCTDLLRPGGYGRLQHYLLNLERAMRKCGANTIDEFILRTASAGNAEPIALTRQEAIRANTVRLFQQAQKDPRYRAAQNQRPPRKIGRHLKLWDCLNCDKCISVCPNDANFVLHVDPIRTEYDNLEVMAAGWTVRGGGTFVVKESHQIATFADACNDCGNCDVFCPEDGGPYREKPRFFGSIASWRRWRELDGFALCCVDNRKVLYGRFGKSEYQLALDSREEMATFSTNGAVVTLDWVSGKVTRATAETPPVVIDMAHYLTMTTLLRGLGDPRRVNFVNVEFR